MTLMVLALTSVVSLFFSLIFSTTLFQRKSWHLMYVSLSLFLLSITSLSLFIGHLYSWYQWIYNTFLFSYVLITPAIFGLVWTKIIRMIKPSIVPYATVVYALTLGLISAWLAWEIFHSNPVAIVKDSTVTLGSLSEKLPLSNWIVGIFSILLIIGSLFLWIRKQGVIWLWLCLSGLLLYLLDRLAYQAMVSTLIMGSFFLFTTLLLYQACRGMVEENNSKAF